MRADASQYKSENDIQGKPRPVPGVYHVAVSSTDDSRAKVKGTKIELEVLGGTVPGQEGKVIEQILWLDDNGNETEKHVRFCMAIGLIQPGATRDFDFDAEAPGRQCVVRVEEVEGKKDGKATGKKYLQIANYGLDVWSVNNPEVANVPKNPKALALLNGGQAPQQQQQRPPAQPQQPAAAGGDKWAGI